MKAMFFIICMLFLAVQGNTQDKKSLAICCTEYDSVMVQLFHFSVQNLSESNYNFTFPNITQSKCLNIVRKCSIEQDTLIIDFTSEYRRAINAGHPLNYLINDTYFLQGYIRPQKTLDLALKIDVAIFNKLHFLKVKLPDRSFLVSKVNL